MDLVGKDEAQYVGMISAKQLQTALCHETVGLTKLQVTSVMCDAEVMDSMVRARARAADALHRGRDIGADVDIVPRELDDAQRGQRVLGRKTIKVRDA